MKTIQKQIFKQIALCVLLNICLLICHNLSAQTITLDEVLEMATKNSLDAYKAKQQYGVNHWQFKSFKATLLPQIDLEVNPLSYNRSFVSRYDSENNIDVYRPQQNLNSYANISVLQNIKATGGQVFVNSSFNRLVNFGDDKIESYTTTPVNIGLNQPLMAFNSFKWQHKTAPLEYEKGKQQLLYDLQEINVNTITYFFDWALATKRVSIATENKKSAEKLFKIGKSRYELGSLERTDVLNLELEIYDAETNLTQALQDLEKTEIDLKLFLRNDLSAYTTPEFPELILSLKMDTEKAIGLAKQYNPNFLDLRLKEIEAQRDLDKVVKENRFDLSLQASYGLNQQADNINDAYSDFLDQQMVAINFKIPLLDWGERKGNIETAKMNKEVATIDNQQEEERLHKEIVLKVTNFNLQKKIVSGALRSSEIATESYLLTEKRFLSGKIDLLNLNSARKAWQAATERYIGSLSNYWKLYYEVQQLTLYDFIEKRPIAERLEGIVK